MMLSYTLRPRVISNLAVAKRNRLLATLRRDDSYGSVVSSNITEKIYNIIIFNFIFRSESCGNSERMLGFTYKILGRCFSYFADIVSTSACYTSQTRQLKERYWFTFSVNFIFLLFLPYAYSLVVTDRMKFYQESSTFFYPFSFTETSFRTANFS